MLKLSPLVDDVTVIVPVETAQVGCVTLATGVDGVEEGGAIFMANGEEIQPLELFAVRL